MTRSQPLLAEPPARDSGMPFGDALAGADGTADPAARPLRAEFFADPLADFYHPDPVPVVPASVPPTVPVRARAVARDPAGPGLVRLDPAAPAAAPTPAAELPPTAAAVRTAAEWMPGAMQVPVAPMPARPQRGPRPGAGVHTAVVAHPRTPAFGPGPRPAAPPRTSSYSMPARPPRAPYSMPARPTRPPAPAMRVTPTRGQAVDRRARQNSRKGAGVWGAIFAALLFLLISGTGRQLLDAVTDLLNR